MTGGPPTLRPAFNKGEIIETVPKTDRGSLDTPNKPAETIFQVV